MRRAGVGIGLLWFMFAAAVLVFAQDKPAVSHTAKAGLWSTTNTVTWQKIPVRTGLPGGPPAGGSHTGTACLTQAMVDAGALLPQSHGQCRLENKVVKPGTILADYVCTGKMKGKGKLETSFPDLEHVTGSIHFEGTIDVNGHPQPIEWTTTTSSVLKSEQCSDTPAAPASAAK